MEIIIKCLPKTQRRLVLLLYYDACGLDIFQNLECSNSQSINSTVEKSILSLPVVIELLKIIIHIERFLH